MKLRYALTPLLGLSILLPLTPAMTRPLLAEAPLPQLDHRADAPVNRDLMVLPNLVPRQQVPMQMSVQSFTPPIYTYQPLPERPNTVEFWRQVGHNAVLTQDYANAVVAFDKALELSIDPETRLPETELYVQRGWAHYLNQDEAEAIADLQTAASLYLEDQVFDRYVNVRRMAGFVANQGTGSDAIASQLRL